MKKIIKHTNTEKYLPLIKPAKNYMPQWYKDAEVFNYKNVSFENGEISKNFKNCMPFFDSLTIGYMAELWTDIYVSRDEYNNPILSWNWGPAPLSQREVHKNKTLPTPAGFNDNHFIWLSRYCIKLPKGYSAFISHPINRFDLPFLTLTGIVDADSTMGSGNLPFFIKKDFVGVIPVGTPIFQIVPFKRDSWQLQDDPELYSEAEAHNEFSLRKMFNYYKENKWNKKTYE